MKKMFFTLAAVAAMLAACNNDENIPLVDKLTDTPISINAGVAELNSRAGMTTGDLVDLGLYIENEANAKYSFSNIEFEKDANTGKFVLASSTTPLWQNETQKILVWAYSPYNAAWTDVNGMYDVEVKTDQSTEANLKASDLLWTVAEVDPAATTQTGNIQYNAGALDITLEHICSKLTVNIRFGDEFPNMMIAEDGLSIEGLNPNGHIWPSDGTSGYRGDTKASITAYKNQTATDGYDETFEAILIPQDVLFSVKIALAGGRTFQWKNNGNFMFKSGKAYTLNLVVGKDNVQIADDGISVKDWIDNGTTGNLGTE